MTRWEGWRLIIEVIRGHTGWHAWRSSWWHLSWVVNRLLKDLGGSTWWLDWVRESLELKVLVQGHHRVVGWLVLDVPLLSQLPHPVDDLAVHRFFEIDVFSYHWVDNLLVLIRLHRKLFSKQTFKLLPYQTELFDVEFWSNVDDGGECLHHVWWSAEFLDVVESALHLVTHGRGDIIARHQPFVIDQSLAPNFCVDLVLRIQVLTNLVL